MRTKMLVAAALLAVACDRGSETTPPDDSGVTTDAGGEDSAGSEGTEPDEPGAPERAVLLRGATVMTAAGAVYSPGAVLLVDDEIAAVGEVDDIEAPEGVSVEVVTLDASQVVTPGIIDTHTHMGVYAAPGLTAHSDGNEMAGPVTPYVRAEDGFWAQDPQFNHAIAGGVTAAQVLPGSANLIGGRSFTIKLRPGGRSAEDYRFEGAPPGLKMACGENPKRVYGQKGGPVTRMGNVAGYRKAFQEAVEYERRWASYERRLAEWERKDAERKQAKAETKPPKKTKRKSDDGPGWRDDQQRPEPPGRDFGLETLAAVIDGDVLVHMHCYRADEMSLMLDLAESYGFSIRSFHHAVEAYKIADRLAAAGTAASIWADWWGFKAEAYDGVRENAALLHQAGGRPIIHSDSAEGIQRLNQEAAKALFAGQKAGIDVTAEDALAWITINPAWALGVEDETGSLEPGKDADVVVWSGDLFSVYTRAQMVWVDGELVYDREGELGRPRSDFDLGLRDGLEEAP